MTSTLLHSTLYRRLHREKLTLPVAICILPLRILGEKSPDTNVENNLYCNIGLFGNRELDEDKNYFLYAVNNETARTWYDPAAPGESDIQVIYRTIIGKTVGINMLDIAAQESISEKDKSHLLYANIVLFFKRDYALDVLADYIDFKPDYHCYAIEYDDTKEDNLHLQPLSNENRLSVMKKTTHSPVIQEGIEKIPYLSLSKKVLDLAVETACQLQFSNENNIEARAKIEYTNEDTKNQRSEIRVEGSLSYSR